MSVPVPEADSGNPPVAWRQSLGAGLLLGLAIGCGWLAHATPTVLPRLLLGAGSLMLAFLGIVLLLPVAGSASWRARWERRLEFQFTAAGIPFFAALVILTLAAFSSGNNLMYLVVAGLLSALPVSGLTSALNLSGMTLRFHMPEEIFAGERTSIAFTLNNEKGFWPAYSLTVLAASPPLDRGDLPPAEMEPIYFPYLPRHGSARVDGEICFPRRGRYGSAGFRLQTRFPFGLVNKRRRFQAGVRGAETLVYPEPVPPEQLQAYAPFIGAYRERYSPGAGQELYRIRPHLSGDSARSVHWKISARVGQLRVREFSQEGAQRLRLRLSLDAGLAEAEAEGAISVCAGLVLALSQSDFWMEFRSDHPECGRGESAAGLFLPLQSAAMLRRRILEHLARVDASRQATPLPGALRDSVPDLYELTIRDSGLAGGDERALGAVRD